MADAVAGRQLRQAEPVAMGIEAQGFGVDRHQRAQIEPVRQIALVQMNFHRISRTLRCTGAAIASRRQSFRA